MGDTESFVYVFAAGVSLFLIAYLLVLSQPGYYAGDGYRDGRVSQPSDVLFSKSTISLDANQKQSFRHVRLGDFSVGHTVAVEPVIAPVEEVRLQNGLFFPEKTLPAEFSGVSADAAYISFTVAETNSYGPLNVILNGKEVKNLSISEKGRYVVKLEGLEEENRVELRAGNSWLRVWAPTVYLLEDVSLGVEQWTYEEKVLPFNVYSYEYDGWHAGLVSFQVSDALRNEPLVIEVNGVRIYEDKPLAGAVIYEAGFSKTETGISMGENVIAFKAGRESEYALKGADIQIFYYDADHPASQEYSFELDTDELEVVRNSTVQLSFDCKSLPVADLRINVNDKPVEYELDQGVNEIIISSGKFVWGDNTIEFSTFGTYELEDVAIRLL